MTAARTIWYVSETPPLGTRASAVILWRHLRSLQRAGYQIVVVTRARAVGSRAFPPSWRTVLLPERRAYYPPYRDNRLLRTWRWLLFDRELKRALGSQPPHCIISLLHGEYLADYAEWLSRRWHRPLFYFLHDRGELLNGADDPAKARRLVQQNSRLVNSAWVRRVWTVSPELTYPAEQPEAKYLTVYPLPEPIPAGSRAGWRPEFAERPVLAHGGTIYDRIVPSLIAVAQELRRIHGRLLLCTPPGETARAVQQQVPDVVSHEGDFPTIPELNAHLQAKASAFLVTYPDVPVMPWALDCFPSKFTQLVQTGLPGMVLAPPETSIARWCAHARWPLFGPDASAETVRPLLEALTREETWRAAAGASVRAAGAEFSAASIEQLVIDEVRQAH